MIVVTVPVGVAVGDIEYTSVVFHRARWEKNILYLSSTLIDWDCHNDH